MKAKLKTGLLLFRISLSRLDFFRMAFIMASLRTVRISPVLSAEFTIFVKAGSRLALPLLKTLAGRGSSGHDFIGAEAKIFATSSWATRPKFNRGTLDSG